MTGEERQRRAYGVGGRTTRERIAREAPKDHEVLEAVRAADIVVVRGQYDHVEWVLNALELPHTLVEPGQFASVPLDPEQLLVVNCPGHIPAPPVRRFVEAGGSLFTTDWALRHVLEAAFPGIVAFNERPTADAVVRVEVAAHDNPFLRGVIDAGDEPLWWLEGSSYPIKVLNPARVNVLISSRELEGNWGEAPVALTFSFGEGEVFHMISHYYLQRTEMRSRRHAAPAAAYADEKGIAWDQGTRAMARDLTLGEVEAAASSSRLFANIVGAHKAKYMEAQRRARRARAGDSPTAARGSVTPERDAASKEGK